MASQVPGDPRQNIVPDARPIVGLPARGLPGWTIALIFAVAALLLFAVLDAHRRSASAPPVKPGPADSVSGAPAIPPLYVPPEPAPTPVPTPTPVAKALPPLPAPPQPRIVYLPQPPSAPSTPMPVPVSHAAGEPVLVVDTTTGEAEAAAAPPSAGGGAGGGGDTSATGGAVRASVMRHRATTVPQGTMIPAVLETALDSTRPGLARALVTKDIVGFDGSRVLIPRGSRLIGDYRADLQPGQNRALVRWTRLVRPDGATIALDSPSADPLGAIGIKGKVNSHFLARFGGTILQSALDFGVGFGSRIGGGDSAVIVGLPTALQGSSGQLVNTNQVAPTLRIKQGAAISVFVAHDLDFTAVQSRK